MAKASKSKSTSKSLSGKGGKSGKAGSAKPNSAAAKTSKTDKSTKSSVLRSPISRAKARKADATLVERMASGPAAGVATPEMKFRPMPQPNPEPAGGKASAAEAPKSATGAETKGSATNTLHAALSSLAGLAGLSQQSGQLGGQLGAQMAGMVPGLEKFTVRDPEEMARNMVGMLETGGKAIADYIGKGKMDTNPMGQAAEAGETAKTLGEIYQNWMSDPQKFAQSQQELLQGFMTLWNGTITKAAGGEAKPVAEPAPGDNRFKDPDWSSNPYFDFWKQAYLLTAQWSEKMLAATEGLDEKTRLKADFLFRQMAAALAPSNFPFTNPEVVRETLASSGQNLLKGMQNLASDMERSDKLLSISQTDTSVFEVGRNIAVTPGKVIYQNELIQLIQYTPTTKNVIAEPLLIVPPWINKFYILDLTQEKSFIKYAVDNGISVFVLSWVNPDEKLGHKTFEDYMKQGILMATDAVARESGGHKPHVIGYCVGGTLLATTMAWLAAKGVDGYTTRDVLRGPAGFHQGRRSQAVHR